MILQNNLDWIIQIIGFVKNLSICALCFKLSLLEIPTYVVASIFSKVSAVRSCERKWGSAFWILQNRIFFLSLSCYCFLIHLLRYIPSTVFQTNILRMYFHLLIVTTGSPFFSHFTRLYISMYHCKIRHFSANLRLPIN